MTQINIPFNKWSEDRLREGRKYCTSRNKRYGVVGDTFRATGKDWRLVSVQKMTLGMVATHLYEMEGADTPIDFIAVWDDIHPYKGFREDWLVWVHFFVEE